MTLFGVGRRDARRAAAVAARAEAAWAWVLWAAQLVLLLLAAAGGNVLSAWGSKVEAPVPSGQEAALGEGVRR